MQSDQENITVRKSNNLKMKWRKPIGKKQIGKKQIDKRNVVYQTKVMSYLIKDELTIKNLYIHCKIVPQQSSWKVS